MNLTPLERPSSPLLVSTGLPVSHSTGVLTTQPWATPTPNPGHWLHPFSLLQHDAALLKVMNNLVYYDFIYLPMTPLAYSKISKGLLLPLTHKAKNYEFMCKNRSTAKNSTGTILENLKFFIQPQTLSKQKCHPWAARQQWRLLLLPNSIPILHSYTTHATTLSFIVAHTHTWPTNLLLIIRDYSRRKRFSWTIR